MIVLLVVPNCGEWIGGLTQKVNFIFIRSDKSENEAPTSGLLLAIEGWSPGNRGIQPLGWKTIMQVFRVEKLWRVQHLFAYKTCRSTRNLALENPFSTARPNASSRVNGVARVGRNLNLGAATFSSCYATWWSSMRLAYAASQNVKINGVWLLRHSAAWRW